MIEWGGSWKRNFDGTVVRTLAQKDPNTLIVELDGLNRRSGILACDIPTGEVQLTPYQGMGPFVYDGRVFANSIDESKLVDLYSGESWYFDQCATSKFRHRLFVNDGHLYDHVDTTDRFDYVGFYEVELTEGVAKLRQIPLEADGGKVVQIDSVGPGLVCVNLYAGDERKMWLLNLQTGEVLKSTVQDRSDESNWIQVYYFLRKKPQD